LESDEAQALENGVCLPAAFDDLQLVAHCVTSSMSFAAAASSAARFEGPVPCATLPATSTSTTKPRLCSGPLTSSVRYSGYWCCSVCSHSFSWVFVCFRCYLIC